MPADQSQKNFYNNLFTASVTMLVFFVQYSFRRVDDNRLTSWPWAFANVDLIWFVTFLASGIFIAFLLSKSSLHQRPVLFLLSCSFAVSAFFWREPEVIVDASRYFTQAKYLEIYGPGYFLNEWGGEIFAWTDMPLVPLLYGLIFRIFGESRIYIQGFITFLFSMSVVLTYLTGKTLWDEDTGFGGGLLLLGVPFFFSQVPLMLVDVPTMFFLTLSIFTFIKALEKGGLWNAFSSLAIFCAVFSKYSTWLMLSVLPVTFLVCLVKNTEHRTRTICRGLSVFVFAGLLTALAVFSKFEVISHQIGFLREYQAPGLKRWGESFISTFFYQVHPFITVAACYSIYAAFRKRDLKFIIACWLLLLIVLLQIRRSRYVMVIFPMLTLMASYGLQRIRTIELRKFIVYCIVASSVAVAAAGYLPFLQKMGLANLKSAGNFLDSIDSETVEVFTIPSEGSPVNPAVTVPLLDLYTEKKIRYYHDAGFTRPFEKIKESPLRFTWEYKNPPYYKDPPVSLSKGGIKEGLHSPVVVISNGPAGALPDYVEEKLKDYTKSRVFDASTGIFTFSPLVSIYLPQQ